MDPRTLSMLQMMMNQPNAQGSQGNPMGMEQQMAPSPQMTPSMAHPHREANPLEIGANSARRSADHTFQMNDDQRRRALGRAIMAFSSHMARPKMEGEYIPGTAGLLASVNSSFNPALEAYQNEEAMAHNQNAYAFQQQQAELKEHQRQAQKLMEFQALQEYRNRRLANQESSIGMRGNKQTNQDNWGIINQDELPKDAVLLNNISDKNVKKELIKNAQARAEKLNPAVKGIKSLDQMDDVINDNPHLWNSFARIVDISTEKNPTVLKNFYSTFDSKDISKVHMLKKLSSDLILNETKLFPGRPTDMIKKIIIQSIATAGTTPEAFKLVKKNMQSEYLRQAKDAKMASRWTKGVFVPEDIQEQNKFIDSYGEEGADPAETVSTIDEIPSQQENFEISPQSIDEFRKINNIPYDKASDEAIRIYMSKRGPGN